MNSTQHTASRGSEAAAAALGSELAEKPLFTETRLGARLGFQDPHLICALTLAIPRQDLLSSMLYVLVQMLGGNFTTAKLPEDESVVAASVRALDFCCRSR